MTSAPTILRGITWDHPRGFAPVVAASATWAACRDDLKVEWTARSLQAFADEPVDELARQYDLIVIDHPNIPLAARQGILRRLDGCGYDAEIADLAAHSVGPSYRSYEHCGQLLALPIDAAAPVAVYRPDLLADPPASWDDVLEFSGGGRMLWPAKPVDAISSFVTVAANRGTPVADTTEYFIGDEQGLAVFQTLHQLADSVPRWCLNANPIEVADALSASDEFCYVPLAFGYSNYSRPGFRANALRYVDMPVGPYGPTGSCLGGAGIAVSVVSTHLEDATKLAFWLASSECQRGIYYRSGGQPSHLAAWEDPAINADCLGFFANTRATLEGASVRPRYEGWLDVQTEAGSIVVAALQHAISDGEALRKMDDAYFRSLARAAALSEETAQ